MKHLRAFILLLTTFLFATQTLLAQGAAPSVEMADVLHRNGKIYLVVLVLVTIFAGILFLLLRIERKLKVLENEAAQKK